VEPSQAIPLISDLGEAQLISNQILGRTYYGNPRYWAPEIWSSHQHNTASDVFSMGRLLFDIVTVNWQIASKNGIVSKLIPELILKITIDCQNPRPERRPSALEICQYLEDFKMSEDKGLKLVKIDVEVFLSLIFQSGNEPTRRSGNEIPA
jgi:hypothetical protein